MKAPFVSIPLVALVASVVKLPSRANCGTNPKCSRRCLDGEWTVETVDDGVRLICDPAADNPKQRYIAHAQCTLQV